MNKRFRLGRGLLATALLTAGGALALSSVAGATTPKPQIKLVASSAGPQALPPGTRSRPPQPS